MKKLKRKVLDVYILFLIIFAIITITSIIGIKYAYTIFPLGFGFKINNTIIILFSLASMVKIIYEIYNL